ncbi:MAG: nickel-dependent lactate racemase [candidate division KSB1 bacterium]|nr:nickel-dependent lactate racemase [candidate division KSB1 bacterium]
MRIRIDYGKSGLEVEIPDAHFVKALRMRPAPLLRDVQGAVTSALLRPIGCAPLVELARGKKTACIAICDITRPVPNWLLLPPILQALAEGGIPEGCVTVLIATGLHRPNEGRELEELVGEELAKRLRIVNHVARDPGQHVYLGTTRRGTPVYVDRRFVEADLHLAVGLIEPHLMAGFSGGRKVVCPGLVSVETMRWFHGASLLAHEAAREGVLEGNPVHREATEVARLARVDFAVNVALDEERNVVGIFAGELEASFAEGVAFVRQYVRDVVQEPVDVVVTSGGGYPLDATFYQAIKGATAAAGVVKPGGTILLVAACTEGLGSREFVQLLRQYPDPAEFEKVLARGDFFAIDQWQYQELAKVLHKADVWLVNDTIPPEMRRYVPIPVFADGQEALQEALRKHGVSARVAAIPRGPYVLAEVGNDCVHGQDRGN